MSDVHEVEEVRLEPHYPYISCDDCSFDTYGHGEYADLAREHVSKTGHHVVMTETVRIDLGPAGSTDA